jgi:hypothetical protein
MMTLILTVSLSAAVVIWLSAYVRKNRIRWVERDTDKERGSN